MEKMIEKFYQLHLQEEQFPFGITDREKMEKVLINPLEITEAELLEE